jgi:hypothetical protein
MSYIGTVSHGVVVLPSDAKLQEGAKVRVQSLPARRRKRRPNRSAASLSGILLTFAGKAKRLPKDIARNHDHYLHGLPRK